MEDKTYGTLVTDCGIQLIAAAVMEGKKINITDLAAVSYTHLTLPTT